jgi:hypothetical protein
MIAAMFQDHCPFHSNMKRAFRSVLYMCRENNTSNLEPKPMQQTRCFVLSWPHHTQLPTLPHFKALISSNRSKDTG